jgi:hypothetical protein
MSTATPTPATAPTAPLPQPAVDALLSLERRLAALAPGESAVINGVTCTGVSLQVADLLTRHRWASARCSRLSAAADYDGCLRLQDEMAMCRCQLAAAGMLHLVEVS